jgi:hypothetical protein
MKKINKSYIIVSFVVLLSHFSASAQVLLSDQTDYNTTANTNAVLELRAASNNKGIVMPKVALTATNSSVPLSAHVQGMTVYNTAKAGIAPYNVEPGFYYNSGTAWEKIGKSNSIGDIKHSAVSNDHSGWYLLDGRLISQLSPKAQTEAIALGFSTNLPNARNKFLKTKNNETIGAAVLANTSLTQANLPNVTFTGTTNNTGSHSHSFVDRASGTTNSTVGPDNNGISDDAFQSGTTGSSGAHTHSFSVSTGGSASPIDFKPSYMVTNIFVFLGN